MSRKKVRGGLLNTALVIFGLIWLIPLLWVAVTAFRPETESIANSTLPRAWTLDTFSVAWNAAAFDRYYLNTAATSFGILAVQLVTSPLAAYAFARLNFRGRDLLFYLYLLQMMIPLSALVIPNYITMKDLRLLDSLWAIMIPYFGSAMATFFLRQSFRSVPVEYEEAARLEGAGTLRVIWEIYLPNVRSSVLAFSLISFSYHWDDFFWPLIVTNSDSKRLLTVGLALFTQASEAGAAWQLVAAATMIVIIPVLVLFLIFQRQFITGYAHSGLK